MVHSLACTTGPMRVAMGGGVLAGQPQLLPRINARLEKSLADYMQIPGGGASVISPELGTMAGPLGAIAPAMDATGVAWSAGRVRRSGSGRCLTWPMVVRKE